MIPAPPQSDRRSRPRAAAALRIVVGLGGSLLFLLLLLLRSDGGEVRDALADAQYGWVALAIIVYVPALWLRAERWRLLCGPMVPLGHRTAIAIVTAGYAVNNVLPVRAGEVVRAELAHRRSGADRLLALGTILAERIVDAAVLALLLAGTLTLAGGDGRLRGLAAVATIVGLGALVVLVVLSLGERERLPRLATRVPVAGALLARIAQGMQAVPDARTWLAVLALTTASWLTEATMYALLGEALHLRLDPPLYLAVAGAANLAITVPSSAGGIGPFEFFARETVVHFGAPVALGTAYAVVLHAALLIPVVAVGLPLLWLQWRQPVAAATTAAGPPANEATAIERDEEPE